MIDVDIRLLMILSTLANTDQKYIQGPEQVKKADMVDQDIQKDKSKAESKKMELRLELRKIVGSVSDIRN